MPDFEEQKPQNIRPRTHTHVRLNQLVIPGSARRTYMYSRQLSNRSGLTPQEQVDCAVDYLTLADMRRVSDARSRATVQEAYGVSKRQVALEQRFRSRGPAVDEASVVRVTRQMMKFSAARYRKFRANERKSL